MSETSPSARIGRFAGDNISRVLVRMPPAVKERATESAKRAGISLNSWTENTLERALENLRQYQAQEKTTNGAPEGSVRTWEDAETGAEGDNLESDRTG